MNKITLSKSYDKAEFNNLDELRAIPWVSQYINWSGGDADSMLFFYENNLGTGRQLMGERYKNGQTFSFL
ncbi:MAG: hypothetical protein ACW987_18605 [Candidatus Thorarchaeota archaeon]|jgi:hypothetical protein